MKLRLATPAVLVDVGPRARPLVRPRRRRPRRDRRAHPPPRPSRPTTCSRSECGVLRAVAAQVGDNQVRHRGTIGGSVAHGDPASDLPAALLALDATFVVQGPGGERDDRGAPTSSGASSRPRSRPTSCSPRSACPRPAPNGFAFEKFNRRAQDFAIVGVVAARVNGAHARRARQHGLDAAARGRGRGRARAGCVGGRRGGATRPRAPSRPPISTRRPSTASTSRGCSCAARSRRSESRRRSRAVVLAAGRGVRFGGDVPKPLLQLARPAAVAYAVDAAVGERLLTGRGRRVRRAGRGRARRRRVTFVRNDAPERGIASSLQSALRALGPTTRSTRSWSVSPTSRWSARTRTGGSRARTTTAPRLAVATYDGARGNPVLIGREHWAEALAAQRRRGRAGAPAPLRRARGTVRRNRRADRRRHARSPGRAWRARWRSPTASE